MLAIVDRVIVVVPIRIPFITWWVRVVAESTGENPYHRHDWMRHNFVQSLQWITEIFGFGEFLIEHKVPLTVPCLVRQPLAVNLRRYNDFVKHHVNLLVWWDTQDFNYRFSKFMEITIANRAHAFMYLTTYFIRFLFNDCRRVSERLSRYASLHNQPKEVLQDMLILCTKEAPWQDLFRCER